MYKNYQEAKKAFDDTPLDKLDKRYAILGEMLKLAQRSDEHAEAGQLLVAHSKRSQERSPTKGPFNF